MADVELLMITREPRHYQSPKPFPLFDQRCFDGQQRTPISFGMMKIKNNVGKFTRIFYPYPKTAFHDQCPRHRALPKSDLYTRRQACNLKRHNVTSDEKTIRVHPFCRSGSSFWQFANSTSKSPLFRVVLQKLKAPCLLLCSAVFTLFVGQITLPETAPFILIRYDPIFRVSGAFVLHSTLPIGNHPSVL